MAVKRNPDQTRERLLEAAFEEFQQHGFRAASLDQILADTGLTKGALYHHFPSKAALGLAVIEDRLGAYVEQKWIHPLGESEDPIAGVLAALQAFLPEGTQRSCEAGCPLANLAQEMAPLDEKFRQRLGDLFSRWQQALSEALERGRGQGFVRADLDCREAALFVVAATEGALAMVRSARDPQALRACVAGLSRYLAALRPAETAVPL